LYQVLQRVQNQLHLHIRDRAYAQAEPVPTLQDVLIPNVHLDPLPTHSGAIIQAVPATVRAQ
jgi:hypothetical protein